tara:strand:- start:1804 stop:1974 length:171 start_codon:yes stop_codon:yes gene_type:complete
MTNPTSNDVNSRLDTIWEALWEWQDVYDGGAAVGTDTYEQRWNDICTAMAWIEENI